MVVDEKGLTAAMKAAYKEAGYKIAGLTGDKGESIMIAAPDWCVVIRKAMMPRKMLGLIVEHMGDIPRAGEAYQVQKKQVQTEIHGVTTEILEELRDPELEPRQVKPTGLHWGQCSLYQRMDDLKVVKVDTDTVSIARMVARIDMLGDHVLALTGLASEVYIDIARTPNDEVVRMDHLSKAQWV